MRKSRWFPALAVVIGFGLLPKPVDSGEVLRGLFPDARELQRSELRVDNFRLALGPLQQVNNRWRPEREKRVTGTLQRLTLEIPGNFGLQEVQQQVREAFVQRDARPLYTCTGLDCGSSNAWANNYFNVKQLYGLDQNQYYGLWEWKAPSGELYFLISYVVQRGNRRIYVHLDQLQVPPRAGGLVASPATLVNTLRQEGYLTLAGVEWSVDEVRLSASHLEALASALQRDPWIRIRIVGHDYGSGDLARQTERSLKAAQQVQKALIESGVKSERVTAHGVGSLAPAGRRGEGRIEIVRQ